MAELSYAETVKSSVASPSSSARSGRHVKLAIDQEMELVQNPVTEVRYDPVLSESTGHWQNRLEFDLIEYDKPLEAFMIEATISFPRQETLRERFSRLVAEWKSESGPSSDLDELLDHPAYQEIIQLGGPAVPLLLDELLREPDHWFWALSSITGADPIPPEIYGNVKKMAQAWIKWGLQERIIKADGP